MTSRRRTLRLLGDGTAAVAALWAAFLVRIHVPFPFTRGLLPDDRLRFLSQEWVVVLLLQFASLYFFGFYDAPRPRGRFEVARRLAGAADLPGVWPSWRRGSSPTASSPARCCCCSWSSTSPSFSSGG